jgi:hypothetical protein
MEPVVVCAGSLALGEGVTRAGCCAVVPAVFPRHPDPHAETLR